MLLRFDRWLIASIVFAAIACSSDEEFQGDNVGGDGGGSAVPSDAPETGAGGDDGAAVSASGRIEVDVASGETVSLRYTSFGSFSREPLVVHFGGPGISAVDQLDGFVSLLSDAVLDAILERYVFIALEEIGVGQSAPIDCPWNLSPDDVTEEQLQESAQSFANDCEDRYEFLEEMDTARYANDLDSLRQVLGFETLNFYGYSYGARVALTYAALFPASTGVVVLDSTVDPRDTFAELNVAQSIGFARALAAFFDDCDRDPTCPFGNGNARASFDLLVNRYSGPAFREEADALSAIVTQSLYNESRWRLLALMLEQFAQGTATPTLADNANAGLSDGAFFGTSCADHPSLSIQEIRAAEAEILQGEEVFVRLLYTSMFPCLEWSAATPMIDWDTALTTLDDVLIVGTQGDPVTPVELADALEQSVPRANRVRSPEFSHAIGLLGTNPCVDDAILGFLLDGARSNTTCDRAG